jgi:hypothetical protein
MVSLLLVAAVVAAPFVSEEGRFSAAFPVPPKQLSETADARHGQFVRHFFTAKAGDTTYSVAYSDYPGPVTFPQVVKGVENGIQGSPYAIVEAADAQIAGTRGRRYFLRAKGGGSQAMLLCLIKKRAYLVSAASKSELGSAERAFVSSFKVLPDQTGAGPPAKR